MMVLSSPAPYCRRRYRPCSSCKENVGISGLGPSSLQEGQTSLWNCFCPGTWVHLVGDAERCGCSMCTTGEFDVGGVQSVIISIYICVYRHVCIMHLIIVCCPNATIARLNEQRSNWLNPPEAESQKQHCVRLPKSRFLRHDLWGCRPHRPNKSENLED